MTSSKQYFGKDLEAMTFAKNYHQWIMDFFRPYLGESIAEVGAGSGNFSEYILQSKVRELVAFEPFINMFNILKEKYAHTDNVNTINDFFEMQSINYKEHFDSIFYINVLEHIEDDINALTHAYSALRKNGHLLLFVPALSFLFSDLDKKVGHHRRYSKKQLIDVVESAGFRVKEVRYFDFFGIIPWYIAFVLLKKTTTSTNVSLYDSLVVPIAKKIEHLISPVIGKNLILVAEKID